MTDELARVIIVGLATWRVASLLTTEEGPWGLFTRLRRWVRAEIDIDLSAPAADVPEPGFFGKLLSCVWCLSPYVAVIFWGLWEVHWYVPGIAAAAGLTIMAERWVGR